MSILVTADLHLTASAKDRYRFQAMEFLADMITERDVDHLIILGDITHEKNYHPDTLVNDVVDLLYNFSCLCPVDILQGNHDYVEAETPFFHFVRLLKDVHWIRFPTIKSIKGLGECVFLPHTRNYKKDWVGVRQFWDKANLIFAHNAFEGAVADTGKKLGGIPLDVLPGKIPVISGDVHKPQRLSPYFDYVGAPYTQKYGDDYIPRVLLLDNGGMESVEVPGPQKVLHEVDSPEQIKHLPFPYYDDMVKVRYYLTTREKHRWPEIKAEIQKHFKGVSSLLIQPVLEKKELARLSTKVTTKEDKELVARYGKQQGFSPEVMVIGHEIVNAS